MAKLDQGMGQVTLASCSRDSWENGDVLLHLHCDWLVVRWASCVEHVVGKMWTWAEAESESEEYCTVFSLPWVF